MRREARETGRGRAQGPQAEPGLSHWPSRPAAPASAKRPGPAVCSDRALPLGPHGPAGAGSDEPGPSALAYLPAAAPERRTIHLPPERESQGRLHPGPREPAGARPFGAHRSKGHGVSRGLLQGACSIFMPTLSGHRVTAAHLLCSLTFRGHKTQSYLGATPQALRKWTVSLPLSVRGPRK